MGGDDHFAVRDHARADSGKFAAEFDHAPNGEGFLGEEEGLQRVLIRQVAAVAAGFDLEKNRFGRRGIEAMKSWQALDEFDQALRLVGGRLGSRLRSGFRGGGWL